ncbi:ATP-grasp domain-containing protein [Candidatus Uabimicrobium sp. HlEnr_7]|uniref:ATP-grasp domain-containing protein n=1 Tax=Candidatus Uabimicrobium helgolandensis TaxID=3095367 RepID=UPI0035581215
MIQDFDFFILEKKFAVVKKDVNIPIYDFNFRQFFHCKSIIRLPEKMTIIARIGAFADYNKLYSELLSYNMQLIHTPEQHRRCTLLSQWYPMIKSLTPRSCCYEKIPTFTEVTNNFSLPIFIKGERQTSKHRQEASIVKSKSDYQKAIEIFQHDPILKWQKFVCREFIPLLPVAGGTAGKIPASYEFRTFWWKKQFMALGQYWFEAEDYKLMEQHQQDVINIGQKAVNLLECDFVAIDIALTKKGQWIVIECNDAMESGYADVSPHFLWQQILNFENRS